jgi:hypothetical protein
MDAGEFFDKVEAHPELEGAGIEEGQDGTSAVLVRHLTTDSKFRVEISTVLDQPWETLEAVLTEKRESRVLSHMTRVVGYFSKVENWNRSKVGELKGRQRGDYSLKTKT